MGAWRQWGGKNSLGRKLMLYGGRWERVPCPPPHHSVTFVLTQYLTDYVPTVSMTLIDLSALNACFKT